MWRGCETDHIRPRRKVMALTTLLGVIVCLIIAIIVIGATGFVVALKLGIIVREAAKPGHLDSGNYTLDQGREVRPEEERRE